MSIRTYEFEGNTIVAPLRIESNEPVFINDSISLSQSRASQGAQRWEISFDLLMKDTEADALVAMVSTRSAPQVMEFPQLNDVNKKVTTTSPASTAASALTGSTSISVTCFGLIPKGSFVKFSGHDKLYMLTADRESSGTMTFFPALIAPVNVSESVYHPGSEGVAFKYWKDEATSLGVTYEDGVLASVQGLRLLEAL